MNVFLLECIMLLVINIYECLERCRVGKWDGKRDGDKEKELKERIIEIPSQITEDQLESWSFHLSGRDKSKTNCTMASLTLNVTPAITCYQAGSGNSTVLRPRPPTEMAGTLKRSNDWAFAKSTLLISTPGGQGVGWLAGSLVAIGGWDFGSGLGVWPGGQGQLEARGCMAGWWTMTLNILMCKH